MDPLQLHIFKEYFYIQVILLSTYLALNYLVNMSVYSYIFAW